ILARHCHPEDRRCQLMNDAGRFLDRWGAEAARHGWSAIDVFGIAANRSVGGPTASGLVALIKGGLVESIGPDRATIRTAQGGWVIYLRRPRAGLSSDWECAEGPEPPFEVSGVRTRSAAKFL